MNEIQGGDELKGNTIHGSDELYTFIGDMYTIGELSRESHSCECLGF